MKAKMIGAAAAAVVVVLGGLVLGAFWLLSTESTSTVDAAARTVPRAEVERQLKEHFNTRMGEQPQTISCAGDLTADNVNDTVECSVTDTDGTNEHIAVSVTNIDGNKISYDYVILQD